ncbi:MAG: cytochrome b6-f complex iron-sulfur subunit [Mucilaginibacter sp.]|jgi:cytochrome b6-f complex iron-sulfur subunit|nr:cytochrome b6-f complex iron-sulfur subunit [Mucilaginibacter sp.]
MDRKDFLSAIGLTAASFAVINCIGCSKGSSTGPSGVNGPTGVDFTLDLTSSSNAALLTNGGYLAANGVLVAKTTTGTYIAVQQSCTHESYPLIYQGSAQRFYCNNHGSAFSQAGVVLNSPANRNLTVYNTTLTGSSLRIYS